MLSFWTPLAISFGAALAIALWALRKVPARWACPNCHHATSPLKDPWMGLLRRWIERRWCARCHWSGISRRRRWLVPTDPPFESEEEPPRPSFEWGVEGRGSGVTKRRPQDPIPSAGDPLGFIWGPGQAGSPSFRWGEQPPSTPEASSEGERQEGGHFQWRPEEREGDDLGFHWGG